MVLFWILEKCGKFFEKRPFFRADMAGLGKYCTGGYGRIGVYRDTIIKMRNSNHFRNRPDMPGHADTVDSVLSGLCLKRTSVLSGQIVWSRQNTPLFLYDTLCVKRTSVLCGQRTDFFRIWSSVSVLSGRIWEMRPS